MLRLFNKRVFSGLQKPAYFIFQFCHKLLVLRYYNFETRRNAGSQK